MLLTVVKYGTPVLRQKGARVAAVTPAIQQLVVDMLETMYAYKGIGLAAQQVGLAVQVTVVDVRVHAPGPDHPRNQTRPRHARHDRPGRLPELS